MTRAIFVFYFLLFGATIFSCKKSDDSAQKIAALEQDLSASFSPEKAKALVEAYKTAVKNAPDNHAANLQYLTKAADIQFFKLDDAVGACRGLADALAHHATEQNLTEAIGMYARIWNAYLYKAAPAVRLDPNDVDAMRANLTKNQVWIDSSLTRLDKKMMANLANIDKEAGRAFIEIAEAYADIVRFNPDRFVDLTMKAAAVAKSLENFNKATSLYFSIANAMPEHPKAPTALFMMGFIYENDLQDLARAKSTYEDFLKKYPNDKDYADDAQMAIKNLGKSPEELIKEFEKQK